MVGEPPNLMKPLLILLFAGLLGCSTAAIALPKHAPVPGGIAVIDLGSDKSAAPGARWGEQPLAEGTKNLLPMKQ